MGKDKRRVAQSRTRKAARVAARKKARKQQRAQAGESRFAILGVTRAQLEKLPIHQALVSDTIFPAGIGYVVIGRRLPDGRIAAGVFLIDAGCLGVKDGFLTVMSPLDFADKLATGGGGQVMETKPPAHARKLIEDAIAYARDLGFEPHEDFNKAKEILGDINAADCSETFTFGEDGKPFYANGPYESEARVQWVLGTLRARCGVDGFHFMIGGPLGGQPGYLDGEDFDGSLLEDDAEPEEADEEDGAPEPPAK